MKHFLLVFFFSLMCALNMSAQVTYQKPQKSGTEYLCDGVVIHETGPEEVYYLRLSPQSSIDDGDLINLGNTKEVAKASVRAIYQMLTEAGDNDTLTINGDKYNVSIQEVWETEYYEEYNAKLKHTFMKSRINKKMVKYLEITPELNLLPARVAYNRIELAYHTL